MAFIKRPATRYLVLALVGVAVIGGASVTSASKNIYSNVKTYNRILANVLDKYVDDVDSKDLIYASIEGMMSTLDPHSVFLEKKAYDDLMMQTQGKYGGVGISIDIRDDWLTVVSPIEGTPAFRLGIRAGDKIVAIEGESTKGITTAEAASKLRGRKGSEVKITIRRPGEPVTFDVSIVRDVIELKSVPHSGIVRDEIGYLRLAEFSEEAGKEVEDALERLLSDGAKGIVFDMRWNHGGLLTQAVAISDLFLEKGRLISYTQGRRETDRSEYYASQDPAIPANVPVVVLVNGSTASASEIVSGALQDDGRALILGELTYGKGLVQTLIPLDQDANLKLTTAKWYTPAGRCIQKEFEEDEEMDAAVASADGADVPDGDGSAEQTLRATGGIQPDVVMEEERSTRYGIELGQQNLFFNFAIKYAMAHPELGTEFRATPEILAEFRTFMDEQEFSYETAAQIELERFEEYAERKEFSEETMAALAALGERFEAEKADDFEENTDYIRFRIERELMSHLFGQEEMYEVILREDELAQAAIDLLLDAERYRTLIQDKEPIAAADPAGSEG